MAFIEAYVTNLGKYNEGELASEPLKFPTTTEEVQALLKRIGVDNETLWEPLSDLLKKLSAVVEL